MKYIGFLFLSFFLLNCLGQLTPPEVYQVNLTAMNISAAAIASANVTIWNGYTALQAGTTGVPPKRQISYFYVQTPTNNSNVAIIPIGGLGPGYSSLEVLFNEIGPFIFTEDIQTQSELQYSPYGLNFNPYALSQYSNLLFIDAIPQVGLSYWSGTTNGSSSANNDAQQVADLYSAISDLVQSQRFSFLQNATFHIIGSGYSGKLAPLLAQTMINDRTLALKLAGMFIGNPLFQIYQYSTTNLDIGFQNDINFLNNHNIFGDAEYEALQLCAANNQDPVCIWGQQSYAKQTQNLNFYDIFRYCYSDNLAPQMYSCLYNQGLYNLLTDTNDLQALHANIRPAPTFQNFFNSDVRTNYNYDYTNNSLVVLQNLINSNTLKIWFYSGDASAIQNQVDTLYYLNQILKLQIVSDSQKFAVNIPNPIGNQVGGFYTGYSNNVVFATVKKAGFLAGKWRGLELQTLFNMYLQKPQP